MINFIVGFAVAMIITVTSPFIAIYCSIYRFKHIVKMGGMVNFECRVVDSKDREGQGILYTIKREKDEH